MERQWPGVIDADDAEQGTYARLLATPGSVSKILEMGPDAQYRAIVGIANQIASKERDEYAHFRGNFRYSVKEVKSLLLSGGLTSNDTKVRAEVFDLHAGFKALQDRNESYANAIAKRHFFDEPMANKSEEDALRRGLEALTNEMNRSNRNSTIRSGAA